MEICVSHFKEDLGWLKAAPWPVTIVDHEGADPHDFPTKIEIPNEGRDSTAFFKFIIDRYDSLPEFTAFIHGHETSYHQQGDRPLLDLIRDANTAKYKYIPLNNAWRCATARQMECMAKAWPDFFGTNFVLEWMVFDSSAQFIVSRDRILNNPKAFYERLFQQCTKSWDHVIAVEFMWHGIFGENPVHVPQSDFFDPPIKEIYLNSIVGGVHFFNEPKLAFVGFLPPEYPDAELITTQDQLDTALKIGRCVVRIEPNPIELTNGHICKIAKEDVVHIDELLKIWRINFTIFNGLIKGKFDPRTRVNDIQLHTKLPA